MNNNDLKLLLDRLITEWENEVVEFKHAGNDYDTDRIGRYFSAMCNEANLRDIEGAWLVFGVDNKTRNVIGSDYRDDKERLQSLKMQMAENTEPSVTMRNIHVLHHVPDFDLQNGNSVKMKLHGKVVDPAYSKALMERADLTLPDIIALDHIQKKRSLPDDVVKRLRKKGLIEGRKPNLHISDKIAKATDSKADYIKTRSQDDTFYAKLVLDYLEKFKKASRKDINILLFDKLSNALDDEQKTNKIGALLTKLRRNGKIWNAGSRTKPEWRIAERKTE
jgi:predicted HTH transcriptional regulator